VTSRGANFKNLNGYEFCKKSRRGGINIYGRETAVCQQTFDQHPSPYPAKSVGFGAGFNKFYSGKKASVRRAARLTFRQGDAGASPEWASVLATVEVLDDRASAPYGGVRCLHNIIETIKQQ
jgi:hypothetical protein